MYIQYTYIYARMWVNARVERVVNWLQLQLGENRICWCLIQEKNPQELEAEDGVLLSSS
jgi:hypothetical protein